MGLGRTERRTQLDNDAHRVIAPQHDQAIGLETRHLHAVVERIQPPVAIALPLDGGSFSAPVKIGHNLDMARRGCRHDVGDDATFPEREDDATVQTIGIGGLK